MLPARGADAGAPGDPEAFARRHLRRNLVALGADFALFMVGLSLASQSTILPAFAEHLGASNLVIGAIPAVMTLGWLLPSLFASGHTETLRLKLPFVLRWTIWERAPFLLLALTAFVLAERAPGAALALLLGVLLVITGTGGLLLPAWMDIVGRTVPVGLRGRFFGVANTLGSAGGLLGGLGVAYVLARVPPPASYGFCFLGAAGFMALSFGALLYTREPPTAAPAPRAPLRAYLARMPALLQRDRNLGRFLVARSCAAAGAMGTGFFTVYALRDHGAPAWQAGVFTAVMLCGQVAGNLGLGWLADRWGHRWSLIVGVAAMVGANAVALGAPSLSVFALVFAFLGVHQAAVHVSGMTILLEFAPRAADRPTYVGLGNTTLAPVAFGAPLLAGVLGDQVGLPAVFLLGMIFALAALVALGAFVRDPRQTAPAEGR